MCDMDGGSDGGYDAGLDMDTSEGTDMDVSSDVDTESSFEGFDDVDTVDEVSDLSDSVENIDTEFESFDDLDDVSADSFEYDEDVGAEMMEEIGWDSAVEQDDVFSGLEDIAEPEMIVTAEEVEGWAAESADPEFGEKIDALVESGRLEVWEESDEVDESDEGDVKVLTREITPEILESRERDTEEVLDNYRENLQDRGVPDEQIEAFVNQERDKINAEYESLDRGDTSSNIYSTPMDWDAVADSLSGQESAERMNDEAETGLGEVEEYSESYELSDVQADVQDDINLSVLPDIDEREEAAEIEEEGIENLESVMDLEDTESIENIENAENIGVVEDVEQTEETIAEIDSTNEMDEMLGEEGLAESTEIDESADILENEETAEIAEIEENAEDVETIENQESDGNSEIGEMDESDDIELIDEMNGLEESIEEMPQETFDEAIDETQELPINYDEIYEGIEQEALAQGFEDIDIYADTERLDSSLEQFETSNWEAMSLEEQKESIADLAEYVEERIGFENPPQIEYYNNPRRGDYGGYDSSTNTLHINEYMLYDSNEAADTIAHELWHAHQRECAENPQSARDYQYQYNFENYIRPEMGHEAYENQLIEAEARAFAAQFKERLSQLGGRSR